MFLPLVMSLGVLSACSVPDLDGQKWKCESEADCGDGFLCNTTQGYCVAALSDEDGVFSDKIVFGMSAAVGNDVSLGVVGRAARGGLEAAFDHVNRTGGVHGRKLQLVVVDDSYNASKTAANVTKMIQGPDRQVFAICGVIGTATSLAARALVLKEKVLFFGPATGFDDFEHDPPDRYVFNVRPRYSQESYQLTRYLLTKAKPYTEPVNIAVFAQGTDDSGTMDSFGSSSFKGVVSALKPHGIEDTDITLTTYPVSKTTNVAKAAGTLVKWMASDKRKASSDGQVYVGVVLVSLYDAAAAVTKGLLDILALAKKGGAPGGLTTDEVTRLKKVNIRFVTLSAVGAGLPLALKSFGALNTVDAKGNAVSVSYGKGTVMAIPVPHYASSASGVLNYQAHMKAYDPKLALDFISLEGYLNGMILAAGLRKHGKDINTESFINTLETLSVDLGVGTTFRFTKSDHQASSKLWAVELDSELKFQSLGVLLE